MSNDPRAIGLPAARHTRRFLRDQPLPRSTVPRPCRVGFIPSCRISSSKSLRHSIRRTLRRASPARVPFLFATLPAVSTQRASSPLALRSVLRFSQPLDGLLHHPVLRACFIPQPRPGFCRSGGSPGLQRSELVAQPCPRAVGPFALTGKPAATREILGFEALFRNPMRSSGSGISLPFGRSPLRLSSSFGPDHPP